MVLADEFFRELGICMPDHVWRVQSVKLDLWVLSRQALANTSTSTSRLSAHSANAPEVSKWRVHGRKQRVECTIRDTVRGRESAHVSGSRAKFASAAQLGAGG